MSDTPGKPLILASASPRRLALLRQIGVSVQVAPVAIDETPARDELARDYVQRMASEKAAAGWRKHPEAGALLAADTIGELDGEILIKPTDRPDAETMLQRMSGRAHTIMTAVTLISDTGLSSILCSTKVFFRHLDRDLIQAYVATGEADDKAGAYGIQERGAVLVDRIEGSYSNVVGLPLAETLQLLRQQGLGTDWYE